MKLLMFVIAVCEVVRAAQNERQIKYMTEQIKYAKTDMHDATEAFKQSLAKSDMIIMEALKDESRG